MARKTRREFEQKFSPELLARLDIFRETPEATLQYLIGRSSETPAATLDQARKDFERRFLLARLEEHAWNISRTAEAIGMARESLSRKMRTFKIKAARD